MKNKITLSLVAALLVLTTAVTSYSMSDQNNLDQKLLAASKRGRVEEIKEVIKAGANVNTQDHVGNTPLHLAVLKNNIPEARELLSLGANINVKNDQGNTPLHFVSNPEITAELIKLGANINAQNEDKETPLFFIVQSLPYSYDNDEKNTNEKNNLEIAKILINAGADFTIEDVTNTTAQNVSEATNTRIFLQKFANNLNSFLANPIPVESFSDEDQRILQHIYNGIVRPGYQDYLIEVGKKFIAKNKRDLFDQALKDFYNNDRNDERRKIYNGLKQQLNLFEMAQGGRTTDVKNK